LTALAIEGSRPHYDDYYSDYPPPPPYDPYYDGEPY